VRRSVVEALEQTFGCKSYPPNAVRPYQLLMLGGDDLLMVCPAADALAFLQHYACALKNYPLPGGNPLGIGAGVVIANPSVPFYRLHAITEALAASAKRLCRALDQPETSFADWMVYTQSWTDDPIEVRQRYLRNRYRLSDAGPEQLLALSGKPYPILGSGLDTLQGLLEASRVLKDEAARSQLRDLVEWLPRGRHQATLRWRELPTETRELLKRAGLEQLWQPVDGKGWKTPLADLVEIYEISRLGRGKERAAAPSHGASDNVLRPAPRPENDHQNTAPSPP